MTITKRIFLGVTLILLIGLGTIAVIYQALRTVEQALYEVTNVRQPTSAAAYEMEINVIGTGLGVLKYLDTGDPKYRDRVAKDTADFAHFHAQYNGLSQTARSKTLGEQVEALYREFRTLGQTLMDRKDQQENSSRPWPSTLIRSTISLDIIGNKGFGGNSSAFSVSNRYLR